MVKSIDLNRGLSRTRRPHPETLAPWAPSKSTRHILEYLLEYRYLTSELLAFLYDRDRGRGSYQVRNELTKLWRHGFVERFHRPTDAGSRQLVYSLSVAGAREVIEAEEWSTERRKVYNSAKPKADYEHALAVSVLQMLWNLGSREQAELFTSVVAWRDKEGDKDGTTNEFQAVVSGRKVNVQPDFTALIGHQKRRYYRPYFFEVERTHKNYQRTRRRFLAYAYLLSRGGQKAVDAVFERELGIRPSRGMVVFIGADPDHADRLRRLALPLVKRDTEMWFTSLDRLFESEPRRRRDGSVRKKPDGEVLELEKPLTPAKFFTEDILVALDGKRGRLVV